MRSQLRRKYRNVRSSFKADLYKVMKDNKAFAMLAISTYSASKHRTHIHKIWEFLGFNHGEVYREYCDKLMGSMLTGRDEIMRSIYFADNELYKKYIYKIPESCAMGDALAVAYRVLKENN